jgi:hypothetical protein
MIRITRRLRGGSWRELVISALNENMIRQVH